MQTQREKLEKGTKSEDKLHFHSNILKKEKGKKITKPKTKEKKRVKINK